MMGTGRQRLPPIHWVLITIASGLVMAHGVLLPQYARHAHLQPGTRELVPKSWIAIQWHQDARLELDIAAYPFPQSLAGRVRQRCERPLYGLTGHLLLRGLARFWKALDDDFDLSYRVAGWILLLTNLLYLLAAAALQYTAAARWLNPFAALIGTLFLMSMGFVHAYVAVCMTHMYIHVPVALLGFAAVRWYSLRKQSPRRPGRTECAGWGLLFGILYLYKPNVAVVLAVVAVLLLLGNVRLTAWFIAALPLAYVTYRIYLHAAGVAYYDHNIQRYQQGVWVLHSLGSLRIHELLREFLLCAAAAPRALWRHFGLALPLAAIGLLALKRHHPEHFRPTVSFAVLLGATVFLQAFATRRYYVPYMWGELFIVVLPLAGCAVSAAALQTSRLPGGRLLAGLLAATVVTAYAATEYLKIVPHPLEHPLMAVAFLSVVFSFLLAATMTTVRYGRPRSPRAGTPSAPQA